jgi:chitinase
MTDSAMFYPMFKILQEKKIYYPKINNTDVYLDFIEHQDYLFLGNADVYLDFIEKNYENHELENKY